MNCPKCQTKTLNKTALETPYSCHSCGGMWIRRAERKILSNIFSNAPESSYKTDEQDRKTGLCPDGHGLMIRARIASNPAFFLEKCPQCGGIWFDHGETERIFESGLVPDIDDLWTVVWQVKQQRAEERQNDLARQQQIFGDSLFRKIMALAEELSEHPARSQALSLLRRESGES